jgi:hypothetical protein
MNPENKTYSLSDPPLWTRETEDRNRICREILYLHELADSSFMDAVSSSSFIVHRSSFSVSPNPCRASGAVQLNLGPLDHSATLRIFDAAGRLLHSTFGIRTSSFRLDLRSMPAGVYVLRLDSDGRFATARLVVN